MYHITAGHPGYLVQSGSRNGFEGGIYLAVVLHMKLLQGVGEFRAHLVFLSRRIIDHVLVMSSGAGDKC